MLFTYLREILLFFTTRFYKELVYFTRTDEHYDEKSTERGDLYTKQLVENIAIDRAAKYDPFIFENLTIFRIVLHNAHLTGLKTLHPAGISALTETDDRYLVNANLGVGPLHFEFDVLIKLGNFTKKFKFFMSLTNAEFIIDFDVFKETGRNGALFDASITKLNGFKCYMSGLGFLNIFINQFLSILTITLKMLIRNLLEYKLDNYLYDKLPKYQFPVEGIYF